MKSPLPPYQRYLPTDTKMPPRCQTRFHFNQPKLHETIPNGSSPTKLVRQFLSGALCLGHSRLATLTHGY